MDDWKQVPSVIPTRPSQQSARSGNDGWLEDRIELLLSAYRKDDYSDARKFVVQLGMILERYPPEVVEYVTDPMTGIQRRQTFPPSIAEVVSACEAEVIHREKISRYRSMPPPVSLPRAQFSATDSYEAMFAKHGRPHGVFEDGRQLVYKG
jgi:hypothetical protein